MCGALFIWMADWYGRTWHIFFGCLGVCIGTIVTSLATNLPMFIGGRFILSFAATCAHTSAPLYLVEISPAAYRGTIAGMYNTFYNVVRRLFIRDGSQKMVGPNVRHDRARSWRRQQSTHATCTLATRGTWIGEFRFGCRWSVLDWSVC